MDKTNQLFLNLPNGTFLFLRIEALINFVLCVASWKEKWIGDRISLFRCPSLHFVTVLRHPVNVQLPFSLQDRLPGFSLSTLGPLESNKFFCMYGRFFSLSLSLVHNYWCFYAAARSLLKFGQQRCFSEHSQQTPSAAPAVTFNRRTQISSSRRQGGRRGGGSRRKEWTPYFIFYQLF